MPLIAAKAEAISAVQWFILKVTDDDSREECAFGALSIFTPLHTWPMADRSRCIADWWKVSKQGRLLGHWKLFLGIYGSLNVRFLYFIAADLVEKDPTY